jgi:hypothetical protein
MSLRNSVVAGRMCIVQTERTSRVKENNLNSANKVAHQIDNNKFDAEVFGDFTLYTTIASTAS